MARSFALTAGWLSIPKLNYRRPRFYIYMRVRWNLNFIRECMENVQESSKLHLLKKQRRNKNDSTCVFVVCFTVCSLLEPLRSRLTYNSKSKTRWRLNRDGTQGFYTRPAQWLNIAQNGGNNIAWRRRIGKKQLKFCDRFFFHYVFSFVFALLPTKPNLYSVVITSTFCGFWCKTSGGNSVSYRWARHRSKF